MFHSSVGLILNEILNRTESTVQLQSINYSGVLPVVMVLKNKYLSHLNISYYILLCLTFCFLFSIFLLLGIICYSNLMSHYVFLFRI